MSTQATSWAWDQANVCEDRGTHLVLLALAEHASPDGICWPARKTIAQMCGYSSVSSVSRHIRKCEELKLLVREQRYIETADGKRRQTSNVYRLQMPVIQGGDHDEPPVPTPEQTPLLPPGPGGVNTDGPTPLSVDEQPGTTSKNHHLEPTSQVDSLDQEVKRVWDHYCKVFEPSRAKLGPNRVKGIKRALQEVDVSTLLRAIDGLKAYRSHKPGETSLETIWKTFKGTGSMVERIEFFASQANGTTVGGKTFPSADPAIVRQRQQDVQRGHRFQDDPEMVERAERSEAWLREHGIETIRDDDGYPTFGPLRDAGGAS